MTTNTAVLNGGVNGLRDGLGIDHYASDELSPAAHTPDSAGDVDDRSRMIASMRETSGKGVDVTIREIVRGLELPPDVEDQLYHSMTFAAHYGAGISDALDEGSITEQEALERAAGLQGAAGELARYTSEELVELNGKRREHRLEQQRAEEAEAKARAYEKEKIRQNKEREARIDLTVAIMERYGTFEMLDGFYGSKRDIAALDVDKLLIWERLVVEPISDNSELGKDKTTNTASLIKLPPPGVKVFWGIVLPPENTPNRDEIIGKIIGLRSSYDTRELSAGDNGKNTLPVFESRADFANSFIAERDTLLEDKVREDKLRDNADYHQSLLILAFQGLLAEMRDVRTDDTLTDVERLGAEARIKEKVATYMRTTNPDADAGQVEDLIRAADELIATQGGEM